MGQDSQGFRQKREEADEWKVNKKKVIQTIYIYILIMPSRRKKRKDTKIVPVNIYTPFRVSLRFGKIVVRDNYTTNNRNMQHNHYV